MRQALIAFGSILILVSCAQTQPPAGNPSLSGPQEAANGATAAVAETLLALSQEWIDTWNQKDVERMAQLHGDVAHTFYGIGDTFGTVEGLLQAIREENYWNLSWTLAMVEPHVRILGPDAGLVSFRLVGEETGAIGTKPYAAAFSLVYQKLDGEWKIVHVHDSDRLEGPASDSTAGR